MKKSLISLLIFGSLFSLQTHTSLAMSDNNGNKKDEKPVQQPGSTNPESLLDLDDVECSDKPSSKTSPSPSGITLGTNPTIKSNMPEKHLKREQKKYAARQSRIQKGKEVVQQSTHLNNLVNTPTVGIRLGTASSSLPSPSLPDEEYRARQKAKHDQAVKAQHQANTPQSQSSSSRPSNSSTPAYQHHTLSHSSRSHHTATNTSSSSSSSQPSTPQSLLELPDELLVTILELIAQDQNPNFDTALRNLLSAKHTCRRLYTIGNYPSLSIEKLKVILEPHIEKFFKDLYDFFNTTLLPKWLSIINNPNNNPDNSPDSYIYQDNYNFKAEFCRYASELEKIRNNSHMLHTTQFYAVLIRLYKLISNKKFVNHIQYAQDLNIDLDIFNNQYVDFNINNIVTLFENCTPVKKILLKPTSKPFARQVLNYMLWRIKKIFRSNQLDIVTNISAVCGLIATVATSYTDEHGLRSPSPIIIPVGLFILLLKAIKHLSVPGKFKHVLHNHRRGTRWTLEGICLLFATFAAACTIGSSVAYAHGDPATNTTVIATNFMAMSIFTTLYVLLYKFM